MKYFNNINNADELRKAYRQHVINMHPDRGGNEEEFKAMQAEFEQLKKQYQNGTRREQYTHTETAEERARRQAEEQREREAWARWEAEERARREQEEHEKAERIRKAQEESRAAVRAWAAILERVSVDKTGEKARYYRFADKKEAAAFVAATKRNITRVINHYFPGLKVKVTISGEIWKEKFIISWEDGPSEKQLRDTCKELAFFIPASYCCAGPYEDYGDYEERHSTAPWREAYGQALGDIADFKTARTLSEEGKQQAEEFAARYFKNWNSEARNGEKLAATFSEFAAYMRATGREADTCRMWSNYAHGHDEGNIYYQIIRDDVTKNAPVSVSEEEKAARRAAKFAPRYGKALRTLQQLTGVGTTNSDPVCFFCNTDRNSRRRLTIAEAVERLERGEAVSFGTEHTGADGGKWYWGKYAGGYKTQDKRAAKFAAAGLTIKGHTSPNAFVTLHGIAPEFAAAIREELADIDRQREAWEQAQQAKQTAKASEKADNGKKAAKTDNTPTDNTQNADSASETAPADGLTLEDTAEGVAVIGNSRTTYKHRREIKAHGAKWNREAQRWEATDPDNVARLRAWFALREQDEPTATAQDEPQADTLEQAGEITETINSDNDPEHATFAVGDVFELLTGTGTTAPARVRSLYFNNFDPAAAPCWVYCYDCEPWINRHGVTIDGGSCDALRMRATDTPAPAADSIESETPAAPAADLTADTDEPTADKSADLSPLMEAVADVLRIFADIMQQAARWEGVTIPAATLERWKQETNEGTKTAAARLCEVCACLASLTPESRQDFDALGGIFWSLSQQLKQGTDPATLQGATDYARAQLFDLIDRTQTKNQARAIREANEPDSEHRAAA